MKRFLRRTKYFGVPRWLVGGVLVGVIACVVLPRTESAPTTERARVIVDEFRRGPVYLEPGAPAVDPERVRQVLGDRPIMVAYLSERVPSESALGPPFLSDVCGQIAARVRTNQVVVHGFYDGARYRLVSCAEPGDLYSGDVDDETAKAVEYRIQRRDGSIIAGGPVGGKLAPADLMLELAEYVRAFDVLAGKKYPDGVPRRGAVPDEPTTGDHLWALAGLFTACVVAFYLLHLVFVAVRRGRGRDPGRQAVAARVDRIGDYVVSVDPGRRGQAEVARHYVLALRAHEDGADVRGELDRLERMIDNQGTERDDGIL